MSDGSVTIDTKLNNDGLKSGLSKIGSIAKAGLVGVTAAVGSVATAFAGLVSASVNARGELEQQIGGIQTLFGTQGANSIEEYANLVGKSTDKVKKEYETLSKAQEIALNNANNAYKTAGLSASDYMATVTGVAASLKQSTKDEVEAANVANTAVIDMSDNANKMGTSMELIQNAYQGFAKQNYTMLDNLKLGYGGTKTEMERLLKDAQKLSGVKYNINNLSDVYNAIHVIQGELGITGTTAKEASETLQGSMASMSAAWQNFLSGSGNLGQVVESATNVVTNVVRIVNEAMPAIMESITASLPQLLELGVQILNSIITGIVTYLPQLMTTAGDILNQLAQGIITVLPQLIPVALQVIQMLLTGLISYLPQILQMGIQILTQLISGIAQMLPQLIPMAIDCIITLVETLIDNIDQLIDAGIEILLAFIDGIIEALPRLIEKAPVIIGKLYDAFVRNFPKIIKAGGELLGKLVMGILGSIVKLIEVAPKLISTVVNGLKNGWNTIKDTGKYLIEGLWDGISGMATWVADKVKSFATNILNNMKEALGIHSPSRLFRDEVGKYIALGVGEGFSKNISSVYKQMKSAVDFETQKLNANLTASSVINVQRNASIQSRLESIDNNREIVVKAETNLDGKVLTSTVNRVNAKQKLQYGIA